MWITEQYLEKSAKNNSEHSTMEVKKWTNRPNSYATFCRDSPKKAV